LFGWSLFAAIRKKHMTEPELLRRFDQALTDIAQLAEAIGEQHWKQAFFDRALQTLANESLPERERLQLVCEQTQVFGGMGSWNDSPPFSAAEYGLLTEFETATEALYEIRSLAMVHLRRKGWQRG